MPIIPPIAPAPTIQIFIRWFLITKGDWSAHRSRAGYPGFRRGALTSHLVQDRGEARDEKSVLNKLRVHPDFVIFPPVAKGGRRFRLLRRGVAVSPRLRRLFIFPPLAKGGWGGVGGVGRKPRQSKPPPPTSREGCRTIKMRGHERVL